MYVGKVSKILIYSFQYTKKYVFIDQLPRIEDFRENRSNARVKKQTEHLHSVPNNIYLLSKALKSSTHSNYEGLSPLAVE